MHRGDSFLALFVLIVLRFALRPTHLFRLGGSVEGALCEGLFSCANAGIIEDSTSAIAKDGILIMTECPHGSIGILRLSSTSGRGRLGGRKAHGLGFQARPASGGRGEGLALFDHNRR